jgi:hypothetical protein
MQECTSKEISSTSLLTRTVNLRHRLSRLTSLIVAWSQSSVVTADLPCEAVSGIHVLKRRNAKDVVWELTLPKLPPGFLALTLELDQALGTDDGDNGRILIAPFFLDYLVHTLYFAPDGAPRWRGDC